MATLYCYTAILTLVDNDTMNYFTDTDSPSVSSDRVIYTASNFARSTLLFLQETGTLSALRPHTSSRSNLESYLYFTVVSGRGRLIYGGMEYELRAGDSVFLDCALPYAHTTDKDLWTLSWCHFNGPEMVRIYEKYKARGGRTIFRSQNRKTYMEILRKLKTIASSDSYVRDMEINALLSQLLVLLMEDSWNPEDDTVKGKRVQVMDVREYIDSNYATDITLDGLSAQFFINKTYLSEMFKEQYGVNLKDYLVSVRITEAKKLLRFTDKTTEEIATMVGINGAAYFSRMFKRVEGVTPTEYRAMW